MADTEHEACVYGGFDYDIFVDCTCGASLAWRHDELSIGDIQRILNAHLESPGLDNECHKG